MKWYHKLLTRFVPTCCLVEELLERDGVLQYYAPPHVSYTIEVQNGDFTVDTGPARILEVID